MKNQNSEEAQSQSSKSPLETAVEQTEEVKGQFKKGLGAIKGSERQKFVVPDTRKITGSLDIDTSTKEKYPEDNRWDYAIEYDNETFFIEIHPGSTNDISTVIEKLDWLKKWLKEKAPDINALTAKSRHPYYWVYTNRFDILPTSRYAKQLAQAKLRPVKQWNYSTLV